MELIRALAALAEPPEPEHTRIAELLQLGEVPEGSVYTDLFLFHLYPYASVYLSGDGMLGGEPADRIAGFWRALGHSPPAEPDHLAALLGLLATLEEEIARGEDAAERALLSNARRTLLAEHLGPWLPVYLDALDALAPDYYLGWSALLRRVIHGKLLDLPSEVDGKQVFTVDRLTSVRGVDDPRESGGEAFLASLFAPARSGMVLTRADLGRAAWTLELGFRLGERRYQLQALLGQNPAAVLQWLAGEARRWEALHAARSGLPEALIDPWLDRARGSAELLDELAREGWDSPELAVDPARAGTGGAP